MEETITAYRICERKKGNLLTLFHGVRGSRTLPLNEWIEAETKEVFEGSRLTAKRYISGFHCLPTLEETRKFSRKFRAPRDLVIVKCEIKNTHPKTHSTSNILLAKWMRILEVVEDIDMGGRTKTEI